MLQRFPATSSGYHKGNSGPCQRLSRCSLCARGPGCGQTAVARQLNLNRNPCTCRRPRRQRTCANMCTRVHGLPCCPTARKGAWGAWPPRPGHSTGAERGAAFTPALPPRPFGHVLCSPTTLAECRMKLSQNPPPLWQCPFLPPFYTWCAKAQVPCVPPRPGPIRCPQNGHKRQRSGPGVFGVRFRVCPCAVCSVLCLISCVLGAVVCRFLASDEPVPCFSSLNAQSTHAC